MALTIDAAGWAIDTWPGSLPAAGGLPAPLPTEALVIQRTGGIAPNRIVDDPQLTFEVYAKRKARAYDLANEVRRWAMNLSGVHPQLIVLRVDELGGPTELPDGRAPSHFRVTFTLQLRIRGVRS